MKRLVSMGSSGSLSMEENIEDEDASRLAISTFQAREEEIERKIREVREKVELLLGRAEEQRKRLSMILEELELLSDPSRKEIAMVRKKIDMANSDLKLLEQNCQNKETEYKEALEAFDEKKKEKAKLVTSLMEIRTESETLTMKKLEELSKNIESIQ
ncbi:hypothetical protein DITRI_Ditri09bG0083400 [Diplodiscus trichospermus]